MIEPKDDGVQEGLNIIGSLEAPMSKEELEILDGKPETTAEAEEAIRLEQEAAGAETARLAEVEAAQALEDGKKADLPAKELTELRNMLRELRNDNIRLQATVSKHERVQNTAVGEESDPTVMEELQSQLAATANRRDELTQLLTVMEVNPKYEDVGEVCSNQNFEDIFEMVAKYRSQENGSTFNEEYLRAKLEVWQMPNPYKYMHETIKEYHPSYQKAAVVIPEKKEEVVTGKTAAEVLAAQRKPVNAPGSIAGLGGGAPEQGGWTAARIDALDETKLHTVPKETYQAYLRGELDV